MSEADLVEVEDRLIAFEFDDVHAFRWDVVAFEDCQNDSNGVVLLLHFLYLFDAVDFFVL